MFGRSWHFYSLALSLAMFACGGDEADCPARVITADQSCTVTKDCVEAGFPTLSCVSGQCALPCATDLECVLEKSSEDKCATIKLPLGVCENQICVAACPDVPCANGQSCFGGRCVLAQESFEIPEGKTRADLFELGWNQVTDEAQPDKLSNNLHVLRSQGLDGCPPDDIRCAGPSAEGARYVTISAVATPEKGTPELETTCRSCACCLECIAAPPAMSFDPLSCPFNDTVPALLSCPATTPTVCEQVCNACEQCPTAAANRGSGNLLLGCEQTAANRDCSTCAACTEQASSDCLSCRSNQCQAECVDLDSFECVTCEEQNCNSCLSCRDCNACRDADSCEITEPLAASCRRKRAKCTQQGADGCFFTPVGYPRAQLTNIEQSLISPVFDLSGAQGAVVIRFSFVSFGVQENYYPGIQGKPAIEWTLTPEEVVVQLCAGACEKETSWQDAQFTGNQPASFPPTNQRGAALLVGSQSKADWRAGTLEVAVPDSLKTSSFQLRFLPRLAKESTVGIDSIQILER